MNPVVQITFVTGHTTLGRSSATSADLLDPAVHRIAVEKPFRLDVQHTNEGLAVRPAPELFFVRELPEVIHYPAQSILDIRECTDQQLVDLYINHVSGIVVATKGPKLVQ